MRQAGGEGEQSPGRAPGAQQTNRLPAWHDERPLPALPACMSPLGGPAAAESRRWAKAGRGPRGHLCLLPTLPHRALLGRGTLVQLLPVTKGQSNALLPPLRIATAGCWSRTASPLRHRLLETPRESEHPRGPHSPARSRAHCHLLLHIGTARYRFARSRRGPKPLPGLCQGRCSPAERCHGQGRGPGGRRRGCARLGAAPPPPFAPCPPPPAGGFSLASSPRSRRTTEETSGTSSTYGISSKQLRP